MSQEHASPEPETVAEEQTGGGRRPSACSASLDWNQSGTEWQAEVHSEFQYVTMEIEGAWHAFLFLGSKYKRGHTIATDFETADEAKQKCQAHYDSLLPQNASAQTRPPETPQDDT